MKVIKIFSKDQLILLRHINPLLGRYRLPKRILKKMDYILEEETLGKQGFLIAIVNPVRDDIREIEDAVGIYPLKADFINETERQEAQDADSGSEEKGREWFLRRLHIQETDSYVYVLYFILRKHLYKTLS